jgi:predicted GTPase
MGGLSELLRGLALEVPSEPHVHRPIDQIIIYSYQSIQTKAHHKCIRICGRLVGATEKRFLAMLSRVSSAAWRIKSQSTLSHSLQTLAIPFFQFQTFASRPPRNKKSSNLIAKTVRTLERPAPKKINKARTPRPPPMLEGKFLRIVILGRPNVGKSTLFNRLALPSKFKSRAIVHSSPGVTRDRRESVGQIDDLAFHITDTAGLEEVNGYYYDDPDDAENPTQMIDGKPASDDLQAGILAQTEMAIKDADVIYFVYDAREGVTALDLHFAKWIRRRLGRQAQSGDTSTPGRWLPKRRLVLVANKVDSTSKDVSAGILDGFQLGMGEPVPISASTGEGLVGLYWVTRRLHDEAFPPLPAPLVTASVTSSSQSSTETKTETDSLDGWSTHARYAFARGPAPAHDDAQDGGESEFADDTFEDDDKYTTEAQLASLGSDIALKKTFSSGVKTADTHMPSSNVPASGEVGTDPNNPHSPLPLFVPGNEQGVGRADAEWLAERQKVQVLRARGIGTETLEETKQRVGGEGTGFPALPRASRNVSLVEGKSITHLGLCVCGKVNVGKSTLVNTLVGSQRVLTGAQPGVTRDAIAIQWQDRRFPSYRFEIVDTAGLKGLSDWKLNRFADVDKQAMQLSLHSMRFAQVVALVVDVSDGLDNRISLPGGGLRVSPRHMKSDLDLYRLAVEKVFSHGDLAIARRAVNEGRSLVICCNKFDKIPPEHRRGFKKALHLKIEQVMSQTAGITLLFCSGLYATGTNALLKAAVDSYEKWALRVSTGVLNRWLQALLAFRPPPKLVSVRYLAQVGTRPPLFALFVNRPHVLPESYIRFVVTLFIIITAPATTATATIVISTTHPLSGELAQARVRLARSSGALGGARTEEPVLNGQAKEKNR